MPTRQAVATMAWFARHELRLAWRDAAALLRGGRRGRGAIALIALAMILVVLHGVALLSIGPLSADLLQPDKGVFLVITGSAFLVWMLLLSQAVETVTRAFYARADLELLLSSPTSAATLFGVRLAANAVAIFATAVVFAGPVIDVVAWRDGARFLLGYGVLVAMALSATAAAAVLVALMFRLCGPARTRLAAQVAAAVLGGGFVVAIQLCAVASYGSLSRGLMLRSPLWVAAAPSGENLIWWPARAALGEPMPLAAMLASSLVLIAAALAFTAPALAIGATQTGATASPASLRAGSRRSIFRSRSPAAILRSKEWVLLWRDPWLVSQSLMQILYLVPPAVLLWRDFATPGDGLLVLAPVLVMASGQLAGGLAWLAISGEEAPDLVATAPVPPRAVLLAKIEAVGLTVALPIGPLLLALSVAAPLLSVITGCGAALAVAGASAIQWFFRSQAKRSSFRRRQTSSRIATFAEAFLSISLAAACGFAAAGAWTIACAPLLVAVLVVAAAWLAGPSNRGSRAAAERRPLDQGTTGSASSAIDDASVPLI